MCVCSWLLNLHDILLVQPNPSNVTGRLYADKRILETRCQKSPQPGVEVLYKKCSNVFEGNRHFRRQCRKSLVCFGIILHRTGEMGSWINAGQLQKLVTPVATTSWRFTVAICRQPKTQRTEPACYRYSAPNVGCQLMSIVGCKRILHVRLDFLAQRR